MKFVIAAFYKFVNLPDYAEKQPALLTKCAAEGIIGSILLAEEGINGTIAGSKQAITTIFDFLRQDPRLQDLDYQESYSDLIPFRYLKVRLKKEIVTIGIPDINPQIKVGTYVTPKEWNSLISNPDVLVIDTRNNYEYEIGTFQGAENPDTDSFSQFPEYVEEKLSQVDTNQPIAMFCTGGIRCEKATSLLLERGFKQVYHLQGGILRYLAEIPPETSLWEGECFVFDQRITVTHGLNLGKNRQWV